MRVDIVVAAEEAAKCVEKSGVQPHTGLMTMWSSR